MACKTIAVKGRHLTMMQTCLFALWLLPAVLGWVLTSPGRLYSTPFTKGPDSFRRAALQGFLLSASTQPVDTGDTDYAQLNSDNNEEKEEDLVFLDFEENDDDDYQGCDKSYSDFLEELQALAFMSSVDATATAKAQAVFDEMFEAYVMDENAALWPNVTIYNLLLDTYAWSSNPKGASDAQHILDRMEDGTNQEVARPNVDSYIKVMEAWANRKQPLKAEQILERLEERFESTQSVDVQPHTGAYNKLIKAWMKSGLPVGPEKAESVLKKMLSDYFENGIQAVKPNQKTWVQVMRAYSQQRRNLQSVEKIKELMEQMQHLSETKGDTDFVPNVYCYNTLIQAIGFNPSIRDGGAQAEQLLYDMMEANRKGNENLRPNGATFINVIQAQKFSRDGFVAAKVEKLLELQEALYQKEPSDKKLKPDVRTFNAALTVLAHTRDPRKAKKAQRLLDRLQQTFQKDDDSSMAPNLRTYNAVLNACAYTKSGDPKDRLTAFQIAIETIRLLRNSRDVSADPVSYGLFLRSCGQLMPPSEKRDKVMENVFLKCCKDGQLGQCVLEELSFAASKGLCQRLLGGDMEEGVALPMEWSRNVKDPRQKLI